MGLSDASLGGGGLEKGQLGCCGVMELHLDALSLSRAAYNEGRGGVWSEDVGARGLVADGAFTITGVVPETDGQS